MKILIIGVNGMLGNSLAKVALQKGYKVKGTYNNVFIENNFNDIKLDISNVHDVRIAIDAVKPDLVVNCAAITNVDFCEENPVIAEKVHIDGTKNLSFACAENNIKFVHVSTDFVFDGHHGNYSESTIPRPINVYGKTKLAGEEVLGGNDLLIRTSIFGINVEQKKSMVEWIVDELENQKTVNVFNDSFFTPIYTGHLAEIILDLAKADKAGLYHIGSRRRVDKFTFAKAVADIFGLDSNLVKASSITTLQKKAARPVDTSLVCARAADEEIRLNDFKEEIKMMKNDWNRS